MRGRSVLELLSCKFFELKLRAVRYVFLRCPRFQSVQVDNGCEWQDCPSGQRDWTYELMQVLSRRTGLRLLQRRCSSGCRHHYA